MLIRCSPKEHRLLTAVLRAYKAEIKRNFCKRGGVSEVWKRPGLPHDRGGGVVRKRKTDYLQAYMFDKRGRWF